MKPPPIKLLNEIARELHELQAAGLSRAEAERQIMHRLFGSGPARRDPGAGEGIRSRPTQPAEIEPRGDR